LDATDPAADASALVSERPPGTLVVNATGMGKDRPGSPVDDTVVFPEHSIAWEFNYRGRLNFAAQARAQAHTRQVSVYDGWRYFIRGWLQIVEDAYEVPIPPPLARELADLAAGVRTGRPT
jgi:shikimate 5-dehydrogenase